jgi:hypothetical protein
MASTAPPPKKEKGKGKKIKPMITLKSAPHEEKKIEKKVARKVKRALKKDFSHVSRYGNAQQSKVLAKRIHKAVSSSDTPEAFRAKLLALSEKFPMMMTGVVGSGGPAEFTDVPVVSMSSMYRRVLPFITVAAPVAGTDYYYAYFMAIGGGGWTNVFKVAATMASDGVFTTGATANDELVALASSWVMRTQTNGRCIRVTNSQPLLGNGGICIMGSVPSSVVADGFTWSTLYNYADVKQVNMPMAQDFCMPWVKMCPGDNDTSTPTTTISFGSGTYTSVEFVAVRVPYSTSAGFVPMMEIECYSNYTVSVLPSYERVVPVKIAPIDDEAYIKAKRAIGIAGKAAADIMNTPAVQSAFWDAAASLGKNVLDWVGKHKTKFFESMGGAMGMLGTERMHQFLTHLDGSACWLETLRELGSKKILPPDLLSLLDRLFQYRISVALADEDHGDAIQVVCPDGRRYVSEKSEIKSAFDFKVSIDSGFVDDDDEKSCINVGDDAITYALKPAKPSLPKRP